MHCIALFENDNQMSVLNNIHWKSPVINYDSINKYNLEESIVESLNAGCEVSWKSICNTGI